MKQLLLAFLLLSGLLLSCSNGGNKVEELQNRVLDIHDSTMLKMDAIYVMIDDLKAMKDSLEADSMAPDRVGQVVEAIARLRKADEGMMDWMRDFKHVEQGAPVEESLAYLKEQETAIMEVDLQIENSLKNGRTILGKSH